ncbi:MAG TPA: nitroreductase family protein [Phycisphaerae bacterium]|nr:nitroreductase family protein [Phycisphaerae bacterium]HRY70393.1 nitroreductase family protein [Phycisphaerae bacterium]HSA28110.1 nitroreductase family protein [Phycisphaerae bacterium]
MDAIEALTTRRSVRRYLPDPVAAETIEQIVNAGRLAPTARNVQPWEFVVVTDPARRAQLAAIAEYGKFIAEAPVCIVVLAKQTRYFLEDGSAATTNMLNAARALGLGSCWVAGDKKPYAHEITKLVDAPDKMRLVSLIALGYPVDMPAPQKRTLDQVIHWESFGGRR